MISGSAHRPADMQLATGDSHDLTVMVTGSNGFIGSHLMSRLAQSDRYTSVACGRECFASADRLQKVIAQADIVVHLAGHNRGDDREVYAGNLALADQLIAAIRATDNRPHVVFVSSTQRANASVYGRSKLEAEHKLQEAATELGFRLTILIVPNVFGPGCRPFYNSVVATFCHQLAAGERPAIVEDRAVDFVSVFSLVDQIEQQLESPSSETAITAHTIASTARLQVSQLLAKLESFHSHFCGDQIVPNLADPVDAGLYTTLLSYIDLDQHRHRPQVHADQRGRLFEIIKMAGGGQIFFSTTKPGVIRGNHYHTRKIEWFCVVQGEAVIRLRRIGRNEVREFRVSGENPEFISIPVLHSHSIENVGATELLTMFWCNEIFDQSDPDTIYEKVA